MGFAPAFSQAPSSSSGIASVSVDHYYTLNALGYAVINDSFTFVNNGTASEQIPTLQVGLPSLVSARASGLVLSPSGHFTMSQSQTNGNTTVTITPTQATLGAGANMSVSLKGVVTQVLNFSKSGFNGTASLLILFSPSVNMNVSQMTAHIVTPPNVQFETGHTGFTYGSNGTLSLSQPSTRPVASEGYIAVNATQVGSLTPIEVTQLVRSIVPAANGAPTVQDRFTVHNLSTFNLTSLHLNVLAPGLTQVTEVPSTVTPLINPHSLALNAGDISLASANIGSVLFPNSNLTLTISYPVPASLTTVSGNSVTVTIPLAPLIAAPVSNYTIILQHTRGFVPSGQTAYLGESVSPLTTGTVKFTYSVDVGWAADRAVPAGILVFAVAFVLFVLQKPTEKREEGQKGARRTPEVLRAFDDKTGLETQYMAEFASAAKGSIPKADFDRMRNEVTELRSRAIQRLNEMKQALGSGRLYDTLSRAAEAEKEEDRAFRDLLNLYMQYHGNRMNEETFKRLQPSYKKRADSAIDHLSDTLHEVQSEDK
ncbi:MAG: hypothetical protein JRN23_01310 [Nitrososphaerota archaeon]|nr:hypothetical protein [Nitrososphaerota archaeon]